MPVDLLDGTGLFHRCVLLAFGLYYNLVLILELSPYYTLPVNKKKRPTAHNLKSMFSSFPSCAGTIITSAVIGGLTKRVKRRLQLPASLPAAPPTALDAGGSRGRFPMAPRPAASRARLRRSDRSHARRRDGRRADRRSSRRPRPSR